MNDDYESKQGTGTRYLLAFRLHSRAYACDVGDPADDMGAQRSVIASPFAVAIDFVARRRQLCNREWRELRKIRI
ncbi:MAG TPA: hypothetical protein VGP28_04110 [Methylocella sp.]|nr:hypothetical protein [Methylocella sp.]